MKHKDSFQDHDQTAAAMKRSPATEELNQKALDYAPTPDEVARRAYFTYVNQGSKSGHEVQHWLSAEAELIEERNLTRVHGFHHGT
jgi:hypothetical protein